MKRHIAILNDHEKSQFRGRLLENLLRAEIPEASIYVFATEKESKEITDIGNLGDVKTIVIPDSFNNESKRRNFISKYFKNEIVTNGMLYTIRDSVEIHPGKFKAFLPELERFMQFFGYRVWLNTVCDECNYIFQKYVSRMTVEMDRPDLKELWDKNIVFTSNANLDIMAFNLDQINIEEMLLDESFDVAMFVIIKFLAERRARGLPGSFMNLYPTIPDELGIATKHTDVYEPKVSKEQFDQEMKRFTDMKINNEPDIDCNVASSFVARMLNIRNLQKR